MYIADFFVFTDNSYFEC